MSGYYKFTVHYLADDLDAAKAKSWLILESICVGEGEAHDCSILGGEGPSFIEVLDEP